MNKVLVIGRLTRDPETQSTTSGIKYTRFTLAVNRQFSEDQTDFIPVVAWRNQAEFVEKYMRKGALVSVDGRFTSSTYQNAEGTNITRYEVTADRVESLETKSQSEFRQGQTSEPQTKSATSTQVVEFEKENGPAQEETNDVPWELDL